MKIKFEAEVETFNIILKALGQMPYVTVAPIISDIKAQAEAQVNQKPDGRPEESIEQRTE